MKLEIKDMSCGYDKKVIVEKDGRDLEDSLKDWNAEQNQSGRHK